MNSQLKQQILEEIEKQGIEPKDKWMFSLKNYTIWFLSGFCLLISSVTFSIIIFMFANNDWALHQEFGRSLPRFILTTIPYLWIFFLSLAMFFTFYNFKHTKTGYKRQLKLIISSSVFISIVFGALFYNFGVGQAIDDTFSDRSLVYRKLLNHKKQIWTNPENGRLAGVVLLKAPNGTTTIFLLQDVNKKEWSVKPQEHSLKNGLVIEAGFKLVVLGVQVSTSSFEARQIMPMFKPCCGRKSLSVRINK